VFYVITKKDSCKHCSLFVICGVRGSHKHIIVFHLSKMKAYY